MRNLKHLAEVGVTGFEPATSRSLTERSTKLSHTPLGYVNELQRFDKISFIKCAWRDSNPRPTA